MFLTNLAGIIISDIMYCFLVQRSKMTPKMATKMRFLDEFKCIYNIYIHVSELLMHTHFDHLGMKMTY